MNEHDSERIAGLLAADGMEPTDDLDAADVVVLNTCCIRENADNKLYGHLGRLKALKARAARPADRGRRLPRPEGPRARSCERRRHVDVVFGTHNLAQRARRCSRGPASRARSSRSSRSTRRTRRRCRPGATSTTRRGSRSRSAATTRARSASCPSVRGTEVSRRMGDIVHEVEELAADGVRRDHAARPERQLLRPRPRRRAVPARSSPTCCARSTRSTASSASASRRRTRRTCAPRRSRRWPSARRCASTCTCRCSRGATARWPACTAATPPARYLERLAAARAAIPDLAVTTDIIVGFPGETDADFERTLEVVDEAAVRRRVHVRVLAPPGHRGRRR